MQAGFEVLRRLAQVLLANSGEGVTLGESEVHRAAAAMGTEVQLLVPSACVVSRR